MRVCSGFCLVCSMALAFSDEFWPNQRWASTTPQEVGLDASLLELARDYALTGDGFGLVVRGGKVVMVWGDTRQRYDLKSTTKSFGATALGGR